ncbi:hypothetical protein ACWEO2_22480 [Nocardia sp. NPDC004278]
MSAVKRTVYAGPILCGVCQNAFHVPPVDEGGLRAMHQQQDSAETGHIAGVLSTAIEHMWNQIRRRHIDIREMVITLASGSTGTYGEIRAEPVASK